jgi:predicted ATP-grasp superfamily ATP-dependent carboligase
MNIPAAAPAFLPRAVLMHPNDGALTVARVLRRHGVAVHALTEPRFAYVLSGRGVQGRVMPGIGERPDVWAAELAALDARGGGVILSGSDAATEWLARNRTEIPPSLRTFESKDGMHLALMNKFELYRLAAAAGVRTPGMWHIADRHALDDLLGGGSVAYPCIVKPTLGHLAKAAVGFGTTRIESAGELRHCATELLDHHLDLVVTELVPGPESSLEGAVTIRDRDGSYALEYGRRKVRQWPPDYGTGSLLASADVPEMLALNRRLLDHVGFHGLSSCEAKRHAVTGELHLIEINMRMPANYGLSQACGADGAWRLYASLAELPLGRAPAPVPGRKVFMHPDLLASWHQVRTRPRSLPQVLGSWRGTRDFGVFALRDPRPAITMIAGELRGG